MLIILRQTVLLKYFPITVTLDTLLQGVQSSGCPLPCSTVSTESKLTNVIDTGYIGIGLTFVQTVKVNTVNILYGYKINLCQI